VGTVSVGVPVATVPGSGATPAGPMPLIGLGTWQLRGRSATQAVGYALSAGYRHIDTATVYGNQVEVGRAISEAGLPREQLYVTTKVPADRLGQERATLEASLRELGLNRVDLWLIHWPPAARESVAMWRAVLELREAGLVTAVGVSNYSIAQLDALIDATGQTPAVNQIPYSPALHDPQLLADHARRGVVVEGYSPLKRTKLADRVLVGIAERHQVSPAQVVLRWHLEHGVVVIPKSAQPPRIKANLDLLSFQLDPDEMAQIDRLSLVSRP
jgi:diketogulonate reductase-like aldo/keto reductase